MANGIISKLIKSGEWTPKIFDYNVYKFDWTSTGKYWKIGKLVIALFPYEDLALQENVEFSTMFCIGNLPMKTLVGSTQLYAPWFDAKVGGDRAIQGSNRYDIVDIDHACAYVRPNVTGTMPKNAYIQVAFIGYDLQPYTENYMATGTIERIIDTTGKLASQQFNRNKTYVSSNTYYGAYLIFGIRYNAVFCDLIRKSSSGVDIMHLSTDSGIIVANDANSHLQITMPDGCDGRIFSLYEGYTFSEIQ